MRNCLIAGNWKMNLDPTESETLIRDIVDGYDADQNDNVLVAVCPNFLMIPDAMVLTHETDVFVGAQNVHHKSHGAYTGEVSATMLTGWGISFCIVGHSERRQYFKETDSDVNAKVRALLEAEIIPIVCVGETLDERKAGNAEAVVRKQLEGCLEDLTIEDPSQLVIAYEPVWAIGTGETATPEQAQSMHEFIRGVVADIMSAEFAEDTTIIYGGSMNAGNASDLLSCPDVDGGLIGGASLKANDFLSIINTAIELK